MAWTGALALSFLWLSLGGILTANATETKFLFKVSSIHAEGFCMSSAKDDNYASLSPCDASNSASLTSSSRLAFDSPRGTCISIAKGGRVALEDCDAAPAVEVVDEDKVGSVAKLVRIKTGPNRLFKCMSVAAAAPNSPKKSRRPRRNTRLQQQVPVFEECDSQKSQQWWRFAPVDDVVDVFSNNENIAAEEEEEEDARDEQREVNRALAESAFDDRLFRSYNLRVHRREWVEWHTDILEEEYVECAVTSDYGVPGAEKVHELAGCRYKGGFGSLEYCLVEGTDEPSGLCRKLSIKVDSNKFQPKNSPEAKQRILGMKKLNFHGMPVDPSLLAEQTSYHVLNLLPSVLAPRSVHANLFVNGHFWGVYVLVEQVDEVFVANRLRLRDEDEAGTIYKEIMPVYESPEVYADFARGNSRAEDHLFMAEVASAIREADDRTAASTVLKYFDGESFVNAAAFNEAIGQTDDWRWRHNFFWYVRQPGELVVGGNNQKRQLVFIPWDYDRLNDWTVAIAGLPRAVPRAVPGDSTTGGGATWPRPWVPPNWPEAYSGRHRLDWLTDIPDPARDFRCVEFLGTVSAEGEWEVRLLPDAARPVACDKITRLFQLAFRALFRFQVRNIAQSLLSAEYLDVLWRFWVRKIEDAVAHDPSGPDSDTWLKSRYALFSHVFLNTRRANLALN